MITVCTSEILDFVTWLNKTIPCKENINMNDYILKSIVKDYYKQLQHESGYGVDECGVEEWCQFIFDDYKNRDKEV